MQNKKQIYPEYDLIGYMRFEKPKPALFRKILNKLLWGVGKLRKVTHNHFGKKADSPRNFSDKILKLVGILLWIIV